MASIRERVSKQGVTTWAVLYRDGGKQASRTWPTKKSAGDFAKLVDALGPQRALAEVKARGQKALTLDQLAERYFEHKEGEVTPRTLADYRRDYANWIKPTLGHRAASSVDEVDVQNLVDKIRPRLDPKSVRDRHTLLFAMYRWGSGRTRRLVDHNPCSETELPKLKRKPPKGMTIPEWRAFYATARANDPEVADMALFLVATGWRWSEAAALTWADVEDRDSVITVTVSQVVRRRPGEVGAIVRDAKNETSMRANDIGPTAAEMLRRRRVGQPISGFVFTNRFGRRWHQGNFLERHWRPLADATFGAEHRKTPHALRHTHTLLLDRSGATMTQMSRRLGHANIDTTVDRYGGLIGDVPYSVLERLDGLLFEESPALEVVQGEVLD